MSRRSLRFRDLLRNLAACSSVVLAVLLYVAHPAPADATVGHGLSLQASTVMTLDSRVRHEGLRSVDWSRLVDASDAELCADLGLHFSANLVVSDSAVRSGSMIAYRASAQRADGEYGPKVADRSFTYDAPLLLRETRTSIATKPGSAGRGLSDLGGVIEQTGTNAAGGRVFTSTGTIAQKDFQSIVQGGLMRGDEVHILTGAHGTARGGLIADAGMLADDIAEFGRMPGVHVHDVSSMTAAQIRAVMQRPGTIVGGFCNSGVCLAPHG